ncbi:extracellular solute-binding protein [Paenibacillus sp. GCM10027626]|uniref:extracellular solute-binding protein n=1 Tax=Paenibacillus sp. GCM10027626 TaxID=3273411 RepID=UPI00362BA506
MRSKTLRRLTGGTAAVFILVLAWSAWRAASGGESSDYPVMAAGQIDLHAQVQTAEPLPYLAVGQGAPAAGAAVRSRPLTVSVRAADYRNASEEALVNVFRDAEKADDALRWAGDEGWVEWQVDVPQEGVYHIEVDYDLPQTGYVSAIRGIEIDGETPFREAERLAFDRQWRDAKFPYDRNAIGQEIRPPQEEIKGWKTAALADYGVSSQPLTWHFTRGSHTIRMKGVREAMDLYELRLVAAAEPPAYREYRASRPSLSTNPDWFQVIEAERFTRKSQTSIQTQSVAEPHISPDPKGRLTYNTIGGERWKNPGEWVEWSFEVPADGEYVIEWKALQGYRGNASVYRTVMIDGSVPFRELLHERIPYLPRFALHALQDDAGEPYRFYLTKGEHTIRLIADASPVAPAVVALRNWMNELYGIEAKLRVITGNYGVGANANADMNRTWEIREYYPEAESELRAVADNLRKLADYLNGLNQHETQASSTLDAAVDTLTRMLGRIEELPNRMDGFVTVHGNLSALAAQLSDQPLLLDYIVVRTPDADTELKIATALDQVSYTVQNFFRTFYLKYDMKSLNEDDALTVWVGRGRDYADLLQEMIEREFTPRTGIRVNVNLMPNANQLLLGNAAGDQPDVAIGVSGETPVDYAMRGAAEDLSAFDGFAQASGRFHPGLMRMLGYDGGTYGLPETQSFNMLFYRSDILQELGLEPPDTWEDVYRMLPPLQENGLTFFYPKDLLPLLFQHGGDVYTADGLNVKLGDDSAIQAFRQFTDLYKKYGLPKDVPSFFNHFKLGDIPIGLADYNMYLMLSVAAPEVAGHWQMAPIPGIRQQDGTVARWSSQSMSAAIMMKKSDKKAEAWSFLDWWTSTDVQTRYALDMESFYGLEYRWNTANLSAFLQLPWSREEVRALKEQLRWTKNNPVVPGYYFVGRELEFAWNDTVLRNLPAREALEKADSAIQRELERKQRDFGLTPQDDLQIRPQEHPYEWEAP